MVSVLPITAVQERCLASFSVKPCSVPAAAILRSEQRGSSRAALLQERDRGVANAEKVAKIITGRAGPTTQRLPWLPTWPASSCHVPPFPGKPSQAPPPLLLAYITSAQGPAWSITHFTQQYSSSSALQRKNGDGVVEERRPGRRGVARRGRGGLRRRRGGGEQVRRRGAAQLGQRPRPVRGRPAQAPPRQLLRRRVRVQEQVLVRQGDRRSEARAGGLRRRRHCFLSVVGGGQAQRVRLRVPGQRHRRAVPGADQPVHRRRGQPGAAHRPLVRPHRRLPHLRRALEPQPGRLPRRRHPHPRLRQQERLRHQAQGPPPPPQRHRHHHPGPDGVRVPVAAAHGRVQLHLERGRLGHARRAGEDGLVARAVRGHVPGRARGGLRLGRQRLRRGRRRGGALQRELVGQGGPVLVEGEGHAGAVRAPEPPAGVGARAPPRLRLLRRHRPLPRPAARVRRPLIRRVLAGHLHANL